MLKDQLKNLKQNWLLLLVILIIFIGTNSIGSVSLLSKNSYYSATDSKIAEGYATTPGVYDSGFAPEAQSRIKTLSTYLSSEIKRGSFDSVASEVKSLIESNDAILLNEQANTNGERLNSQKYASYQIKVPSNNYKSLLNSLKQIGDLKDINEQVNDITDYYLDLQVQLEAETQRLARYKQLFDSSQSTEDKLTLTDRIFEQERTIAYLTEAIQNQDQSVVYSTIYFSISEKPSSLAGTTFITLGEIIKSFISSLVGLIKLIVIIIPYLILLWIIKIIYKKYN